MFPNVAMHYLNAMCLLLLLYEQEVKGARVQISVQNKSYRELNDTWYSTNKYANEQTSWVLFRQLK